MQQILMVIFYPIGWIAAKALSFGRIRPASWDRNAFFETKNESIRWQKEEGRIEMNFEGTAALGLILFLVSFVPWAISIAVAP
jgi:hypothetical protein